MKKRLAVTALSLFLSFSVVASAAPNNDSLVVEEGNPEQVAQKVVEGYLTAMESKNFEAALELVVDTRYPDKEVQLEKYEKYSDKTNFDDVSIVDTKVLSDTSVVVSIEEDSYVQDLNVKKIDDTWKLILGDGNPSTVAALNPPEVVPFAAVDYYEFFGVSNGTVLYGQDSFSVGSSNRATIKGWQTTGVWHTSASVEYAIVEDQLFGWREWSVPVTVDGNIEKEGSSWYEEYFLGIPEGSDYHIRITGKTANWTVDGAGNVYVS